MWYIFISAATFPVCKVLFRSNGGDNHPSLYRKREIGDAVCLAGDGVFVVVMRKQGVAFVSVPHNSAFDQSNRPGLEPWDMDMK